MVNISSFVVKLQNWNYAIGNLLRYGIIKNFIQAYNKLIDFILLSTELTGANIVYEDILRDLSKLYTQVRPPSITEHFKRLIAAERYVTEIILNVYF